MKENGKTTPSATLRAILGVFLMESNRTYFSCHSPTTLTSEEKSLAMGDKGGVASTAALVPTSFLLDLPG